MVKRAFLTVCSVVSSLSSASGFISIASSQLSLLQHARALQNNLHVLTISVKPGDEDLSALSYLRYERGAKILSLYVTNGESGESGIGTLYPNETASERRTAAFRALKAIGGDVYFLCLPDFGAADDSSEVRTYWTSDSLQSYFARVISDFRPDLIIVNPEREIGWKKTARWKIMLSDLRSAVTLVSPTKVLNSVVPPLTLSSWEVDWIISATSDVKGLSFPITRKHALLQKTYFDLGKESGQHYQPILSQWLRKGMRTDSRYEVLKSHGVQKVTSLDRGLKTRRPQSLKKLDSLIARYGSTVEAGVSRGSQLTRVKTQSLLDQLVILVDSVDYRLSRMSPSVVERKFLLGWKEGLESIRHSLLGVKVKVRVSDTILTQRQLTYITIDSVSGLTKDGTTEVFFPSVNQGWILNESVENRLPLSLGEDYRLITPLVLDYNFPDPVYGIANHMCGSPFSFFIIHRAKTRRESFYYRANLRFFFAPRFSVEILTPLVFASDDEQLIVRLRNQSRDGVTDRLLVSHDLVEAQGKQFMLETKDAMHLDTLSLKWKDVVPEGDHLIPLRIGTEIVGNFAVRNFHIAARSNLKIGLFSHRAHSVLDATLRRLGVYFYRISQDASPSGSEDVVIFDQGALSSNLNLKSAKQFIRQLIENGTHVIFLAQDEESWNELGLTNSFRIGPYQPSSPIAQLAIDSTHAFLTTPNKILSEHWDHWIFYRSFHQGKTLIPHHVEIPIKKEENGALLIFSERIGKGRLTYVALDLNHQLLNIHKGAMAFLANLISYQDME